MNQLYVFLISGVSFYATGSLNAEDINKVENLLHSFMSKFPEEPEETLFNSFIREILTKYKIRLKPVKINHVFRFI